MALPVHVQLTGDLLDVPETARRLRETGVSGVFSYEGPHDVFLPLALAATSDLDLMTNVAIAFPRSPIHLAHVAYDLQAASGGRFRLGLGSQVKAHITRRYGTPWSKPVERMQETVTAIRAILACWQDGNALDVHGEFWTHTLMPPLFNPGPNPHGLPKIVLAGVGPRMTALAGEVADGLIVHPLSSDTFLRENTERAFLEGLRTSGRARTDVELIAQVMVGCARTEERLVQARAAVRHMIGFYGSTPAYRPVLDAEGYGDLHLELHGLVSEGKWGELASRIPDDLLDRIAIVGTPEDVGARIRRRADGVADSVCLAASMPIRHEDLADLVAVVSA
ncbi:MAG TPA: TIGR03617 family F420-dependent LLM class oxidoreductase [Mycobacteriales bacterium]|nr:TIGR03617 family F420-dependent LLM class oxidoreductase [Mycobacteriales bacterium]